MTRLFRALGKTGAASRCSDRRAAGRPGCGRVGLDRAGCGTGGFCCRSARPGRLLRGCCRPLAGLSLAFSRDLLPIGRRSEPIACSPRVGRRLFHGFAWPVLVGRLVLRLALVGHQVQLSLVDAAAPWRVIGLGP